jgi:LysM repeat protein
MSRKVAIFVVSPGLVLSGPAFAQPATESPATVNAGPVQSSPRQSTRPAAVDAAFGTPPPEARFGPETYGEAGFVDRGRSRPPEQTYRSTSTSIGPDGEVIGGYQIYDESLVTPPTGGYADEVPEYHVVQRGDTLYDISAYYLADPYLWPKVWSWNENVTNAHWIFPGDRIRLHDPSLGDRRRTTDDPGLRYPRRSGRDGDDGSGVQDSYVLNQIAYVDKEEFETSMKIVGGAQAKVMMATLDTAYMTYDKGNPPIAGERLIVYAPTEEVKDIKNKETIGYLVQIMGEAQVETVAREAAEGTIVNALNPVERGYRVGPLRRVFRRVDTQEAETSASGLVVATLVSTGPIPIKMRRPRRQRDPHVLAGEDMFVVIDLGSKHGVKEGHVLDVVRKGDEYTKKRNWEIPYEDGWPRRVIAKVLAIDVQEGSALCAVVDSRREIERGDHVEQRGRGMPRGDDDREDRDRGQVNAEASAQRDGGKAKAGFSLGGEKK